MSVSAPSTEAPLLINRVIKVKVESVCFKEARHIFLEIIDGPPINQ